MGGVTKDEQIEMLQRTIIELRQIIVEQQRIIQDLMERLGMNSSNSSKPPSSDGLKKPSPKSLRSPSGKKPGGQTGHPGTHLFTDREPDEIVRHMPSACLDCPSHDVCMGLARVGETRQVIDAVVTVRVTAHESLVVECPLNGARQRGAFPEELKASVQYGENLQALAVAMNTVGAVSVNRTHEILSGVFGIPLSTGTISAMVGSCADQVTEVVERIRQKLTVSGLIHHDETGTRVDGKTFWVHNASNVAYTHLSISTKRGQEGMDAGGVLPEFEGIAVHDCWAPYWKYPRVTHALCCAHLLRELVGVEENHPEQGWATDFKRLLLEMKEAKEQEIELGNDHLSDEQLQAFDQRYDEILGLGYTENPLSEVTGKRLGRRKKGKTLALLERLDTHKASVCLFVHNFAVPFDNNQAERDLRMIKTKSKVSGCFRSTDGARDYLKIMSYVGSAKKQGVCAYEAIRQAVLGTPETCFC